MTTIKAEQVSKPKVAFFDFACCEGCQIELTNFGDKDFLELLQHIDVVEFRETMSEKSHEPLDIACIEGSYTRAADRERLLSIRKRAKVVIAYGQCATTGGINALKNHQDDYAQYVYGRKAGLAHLDSSEALPISSVIKVDYNVYGCPINRYEFLDVVSHLLHLKAPVIPNYPVCVECKRRETICRVERGEYCLGMVSRAGCGAPCPADGIPCEGCRGFTSEANFASLEKLLGRFPEFSKIRRQSMYQLFNGNVQSCTQAAGKHKEGASE